MNDVAANDCNRFFADLLPADFLAWEEETGQAPSKLPAIKPASDLCHGLHVRPAEVVHGVLYQGGKLIYGGPSKGRKSWTLLDLCVAVAAGLPWLDFPTTQGPTLYIDFELQEFALADRLAAVCKSRGIPVPPALHVWNLRGHSCPLDKLIPELEARLEDVAFSLIVPDPIYKTLQGRDENSAGDIGRVCNEIEQVAVQTGAAVAYGHHFAKGNAGAKEHLDRTSGSGVFARDPDAILTATPHQEDDAFTLEMSLRNFPPQDPFVVRWAYPRMVRDADLEPCKHRQPGGRKPIANPGVILKDLAPGGMSRSAWMAAAGVPNDRFSRYVAALLEAGVVSKTMRGREAVYVENKAHRDPAK